MSRIALLLGLAAAAAAFGFTHWKSHRIAVRFPPQGAFAALEGGRIHMTQRLPEGEPRATVLLLHGASGNQADMMFALGPLLAARGFRVIAADRPGHGWSDRFGGADAASPAVQARILRQAMEKTGVTHAIVLGHSLAGAAAVNFALDHKDFTDGLVLVAPVTHPWPGGIAWYYSVAATPALGDLFARLITLPAGLRGVKPGVAAVFAPEAAPPGFASATGVALVLRPDAFVANAQDVAGLKAFVAAQAPRMKEITAPTAIVTGDSDGVVLTHIHSYGSARDIPSATLKVLAGVGHSPHNNHPEEVAKAVEEVAERIAAGRK